MEFDFDCICLSLFLSISSGFYFAFCFPIKATPPSNVPIILIAGKHFILPWIIHGVIIIASFPSETKTHTHTKLFSNENREINYVVRVAWWLSKERINRVVQATAKLIGSIFLPLHTEQNWLQFYTLFSIFVLFYANHIEY